MSLFFDADWFDARLSTRGLDRNDLAACAKLERTDLHRLFTNERPATAEEIAAFAALLEADVVEINVRCGVMNAQRETPSDPAGRIEDIEARLNEIDRWLAELEAGKKRA